MRNLIVRLYESAFDWPFGTILTVILVVLIFLAVFLVGQLLFAVYDSSFLPMRKARGKITGKKYSPATTSMITTYNVALKMPMTSPVYIPEQYSLDVEIQEGRRKGDISVDEEFYRSAKEGDQVFVGYVVGRVTGDTYLKEITAN